MLLEHGRDFGVIDMAAVAWLVWRIQSVQHGIRVPGVADGGQGQALELAEIRRRHIGAVLLDFQFRLDANLFEGALGQLRRIDDLAGPAPVPLVVWSSVLKPLGTPASASKRLASLGSY